MTKKNRELTLRQQLVEMYGEKETHRIMLQMRSGYPVSLETGTKVMEATMASQRKDEPSD